MPPPGGSLRADTRGFSGRTLEELDELFSAPNPVQTSKQKRVVAIKKEGGKTVIVDDA